MDAVENVVVFPVARTRQEAAHEFLAAYHEAAVARAKLDLSAALSQQAHLLASPDEYETKRQDYWKLFDELRAALSHLAIVPARSRHHLNLKRSAIGKGWLDVKAMSDPFYARVQAGVAADEAALVAQIAARKRDRVSRKLTIDERESQAAIMRKKFAVV